MDCRHHGGEGRDLDGCGLCRIEIELGHVFGTERAMPRYRYWEIKAKGRQRRTFEYTTEKALGFGGKEPERYWAIERRWVKVKGGEQAKTVRTVGFSQRQKAKARALAWYEKAKLDKSIPIDIG